MSTTSHPPSFFFTDTASTGIYTLSLHDALPISEPPELNAKVVEFARAHLGKKVGDGSCLTLAVAALDRKSTRLNSSHVRTSYAVFCVKKKNLARGGNRMDAALVEDGHDPIELKG